MKKIILICLFVFCLYGLYADKVIFAIYGIAPSKEYSSMDWPEQTGINVWKCWVVNDEWYGSIEINSYELANSINYDGYISLEIKDHLMFMKITDENFILLPLKGENK